MRRTLSFVIAAIVGIGLALPALGQEAEDELTLCDYTPPRNELTRLTLSGDYQRFNDRREDDRGNIDRGQLRLEGLAWSEGGPWSYNVNGQAHLRISPSGVSLASQLSSNGQIQRYVRNDTFVFGGANTTGLPGEGLTVSTLAGAGLGRFQNVTPMARAIRIGDALQGQGILDSRPSEQTLREIAQIIGQRREIGVSGVLREIEALLETSLDVDAVLTLQTILNTEMTRFCGWNVTGALGYDLLDPMDRNAAFFQASADYAITLDPNGRILLRSTGRLPLPPGQGYRINASMDYERTLSPTTSLTTTYTYNRTQAPDGTTSQTHTANLVVNTQVSPSISVTAEAEAAIGSDFAETEWGVDLGFRYALF